MRKSSSEEVFQYSVITFHLHQNYDGECSKRAEERCKNEERAMPGALDLKLSSYLHMLVQRLLNRVFWHVPNNLLRYFTVFEDQQRRNSADAIAHWS